jgi:hypothetical protein
MSKEMRNLISRQLSTKRIDMRSGHAGVSNDNSFHLDQEEGRQGAADGSGMPTSIDHPQRVEQPDRAGVNKVNRGQEHQRA